MMLSLQRPRHVQSCVLGRLSSVFLSYSGYKISRPYSQQQSRSIKGILDVGIAAIGYRHSSVNALHHHQRLLRAVREVARHRRQELRQYLKTSHPLLGAEVGLVIPGLVRARRARRTVQEIQKATPLELKSRQMMKTTLSMATNKSAWSSHR